MKRRSFMKSIGLALVSLTIPTTVTNIAISRDLDYYRTHLFEFCEDFGMIKNVNGQKRRQLKAICDQYEAGNSQAKTK